MATVVLSRLVVALPTRPRRRLCSIRLLATTLIYSSYSYNSIEIGDS